MRRPGAVVGLFLGYCTATHSAERGSSCAGILLQPVSQPLRLHQQGCWRGCDGVAAAPSPCSPAAARRQGWPLGAGLRPHGRRGSLASSANSSKTGDVFCIRRSSSWGTWQVLALEVNRGTDPMQAPSHLRGGRAHVSVASPALRRDVARPLQTKPPKTHQTHQAAVLAHAARRASRTLRVSVKAFEEQWWQARAAGQISKVGGAHAVGQRE
jgi:hypothetical protein